MPFKWVQCRVCARTMHINSFPEPNHKVLKRLGQGTCKRCDYVGYGNRAITTDIFPVYQFIKECEAIND